MIEWKSEQSGFMIEGVIDLNNNIAIKLLNNNLMQTDLNARPRSMSAKAPTNRSRPLSGMTTTTMRFPSKNLKTQLITSIYHGKQKSPAKRNSSKNLLYQGISTEQLAKFKKNPPTGVTKSKQELYEQNMQLKKQINKLSEQLTIVKGKSEHKSKKAVSRQKQLEIQFEKETFWAGTKSHMISGIKFQYQKLKKQHTQQSKLLNDLKRSLLQSKIPQYKIYSEAVQKQNKRLSEKLHKILQVQQGTLQNAHPDREISTMLLAEAEQNCRILQDKLVILDVQLRNANQSLKDKDKKILFLERLIIQKDNREHHMGRKLKKMEKNKEQLEEFIRQMNEKAQAKQKQWNDKQKQLNTSNQQEIYKIHESYAAQLTSLNNKIKNLEEGNRYLENTVNKLRMSSSAVINTSNVNNRSSLNVNGASARKNVSPLLEFNTSREGKLDEFDSVASKAIPDQKQGNKQKQVDKEGPKSRTIQKADKKHSQNSKKSRKVQYSQVQQLGQILKYRLINSKIDPAGLKKFLDPNQSASFFLQSPQQQQWQQKHITTSETEKVLRDYPFNLEQEFAFTLARYMTEDCHEDYVYYDPGNENMRDIVKSILKSVIGEYILPNQQIKRQAQVFMDKYETNLESALRTYYPSGKVSKRKFLDTMNGLGVQVAEEVCQYLLAQAVKNSKNLQQIEYGILFEKHNKN